MKSCLRGAVEAFAIALTLFFGHTLAALEVDGLRCEYAAEPVIAETRPRLSWKLIDTRRGVMQSAYRVQVASTLERLEAGEADLWDPGWIDSSQSQHVAYRGEPLRSRDEAFWRVRVSDVEAVRSGWSEPAHWEMALVHADEWSAKWISFDTRPLNSNPDLQLPPCPMLRREFDADKPIRKARVYVTALGLYELSLNGKRVGGHRLAPGWTDYHKRIYYQTYDVTRMLHQGTNAIGAVLSFGWHSGYVGYALSEKLPKPKDFYGEYPSALVQLEIEYEDGTSQTITSDESWTASTGPVLESDIQMGVTYDARLEQPGWNRPGFDDSAWQAVAVVRPDVGALQAQPHEPIRITEEVQAKRVFPSPNGGYIFDFGQNFAGVARLQLVGDPGQEITIRFGEMLHPDGRLMTENLRAARATDRYICRGGDAAETWVPRFTYHGYQFAEIQGLSEPPTTDMLTGLVLESDLEPAGRFTSSSPVLNKVYSNITWTQRANFIDIPTDCPQRDERLGWTGDAQIYVRSAAWNRRVPRFFAKWAVDCSDAQWPNGAYPNFAPRPYSRENKTYSPAWMEAGIICPWTMYRVYGDSRILEANYESMKRFVEFHIEKAGPDMVYSANSWDELDPSGGWGDWLALGPETPKEIIATFYYGLSLRLMSEIATVAGREDDAVRYGALYAAFLERMLQAYVSGDGTIRSDTQTVYALAIAMGFLPADVEERAGDRLVELIESSDGRMQTGFLGTRYLPHALTQIGRSDLAYGLLLSTRYPGWGYEVVNGATSIWERWNSYTLKDGFGAHNAGMNSFSHYAFGSICQWMFEHIVGINTGQPGFQDLRLAPKITKYSHLGWAEGEYNSCYGPVSLRWELSDYGEEVDVRVAIPPNTRATIVLPCLNAERVMESETPLAQSTDITLISEAPDSVVLGLGSGEYHFSSIMPQ